jgi:hypothetical protein
MTWLSTFILAIAMSTTAGAQNAGGGSRERWGLENSAPSGLGRSADRALPLVEPNSRRFYQSPNKLDDRDTRSTFNPFVGRRGAR